MTLGSFLVLGFVFLLQLEEGMSSASARSEKKKFRLLFEALELGLQVFTFSLICFFAAAPYLRQIGTGGYLVFLLPAVYGFNALRKRTEFFTLGVIAFCIYFEFENSSDLLSCVIYSCLLAVAFYGLRLLLEGLCLRLAFTSVPERIRGLPLVLFSAFLLALAVLGLEGIGS